MTTGPSGVRFCSTCGPRWTWNCGLASCLNVGLKVPLTAAGTDSNGLFFFGLVKCRANAIRDPSIKDAQAALAPLTNHASPVTIRVTATDHASALDILITHPWSVVAIRLTEV